ncbi:hypothetical protein F511_27160 [Dorcoceras hygrometricum]|uniref:Uncharacterized protein n=1 Tax=Dorcoceras hygrometricum TaxID=472368 RepID=A0A2Z7D4E7_9LAMI|nr:hypothetical protein F511_27160 [Dorcoceras hygrometricum]
MSSPDSNVVRNVAEFVDSSSLFGARAREDEISSLADLHRARILRIDHDDAQLAAQGCTWYEVKASTLRESDLSLIRDKAGISELYEVVVPRVEARAHRPSAGFHTFNVNQIDRGLRFPIPKFIASLCEHLEVSPSQLTPNSFSSLLSLGILLQYFRIPLSTYTLMRLIQIKNLGPGKFYISNKKELGFIGGNPSSHKGWMSRYFFIKRISSRENPWGCNMSSMSSPECSVVRNVAEFVDSSSLSGARGREDKILSSADLHRARILRIDHDEAQLAAQGCT